MKECEKSDIIYFPIVSENERILENIKHYERDTNLLFYEFIIIVARKEILREKNKEQKPVYYHKFLFQQIRTCLNQYVTIFE